MAGTPCSSGIQQRSTSTPVILKKIMDDSSEEDERLNAPKIHMLPIWDDGRMIVEKGHFALKCEMKFATRKYRAPYGLEQLEMRKEGKELDAAGSLYVALTEYKKLDPATPSPLSVGTPYM